MPELDRLTPQQARIVSLASDGYTDQRIAAELGISINSVRDRWRRAFATLHTNDRAHTVATALRQGEIV
jgi:DNA-binding CsgD family transcriptional regulator